MLDSDGLLITNDAYLTLSFADDGVDVAGQSNALADKFASLAPAEVWQSTILRAFQTWASRTNADIGVVDDGGQPFGAAGTDRGDSRFGDIRIAAIAMAPEIGAVSVPINGVVGGSWTADVIFNTNFAFQSLDTLYAIALHEAGNVLGLADSDDPLSPLHPGSIPTAIVPTAIDTSNLQALYGIRVPDLNEASSGNSNNNSFNNATRLRVNDYTSDDESDLYGDGSAPSIVYGDIRTIGDVDYFEIDVPDQYSGPTTFRLRSAGISLLAPRLLVYNEQRQLVREVASTSSTGDVLSIALPNVAADGKYYVQIAAATTDCRASGGYSLVVTFDDINQVAPEIIESYADGSLRKLGQGELRKIFDADAEDSFYDDSHTDDDPLEAVTLESESEFSSPNRFETIGSITNALDQDFYRIRSPEIGTGFSVLTIAVRSLEAGTLVPRISVLDHSRHIIPSTILANGAGQLIVQIAASADEDYYVAVSAADPAGPFASGNYQLTASFGDHAAEVQQFAAGTLPIDIGQNVHKLYVAEPQLFHFLLQAEPGASPHLVIATLYDASNQPVHRLATSLGDVRSSSAVLLAPGTYQVVLSASTLDGPAAVPIDYQLRGLAISDPFVSDPNDPTTSPFHNSDPSLDGAYLYPGGIPSDDPYLWDDFVASLPEPPPPLPPVELMSILMRDWWPWYWSQIGVAGPPLAVQDSYTTPAGAPLIVPTTSGVLSNDIEPDGAPMGVMLISGPRSGELTLNTDGSFQYSPATGFNGTDRFTYQASDFSQMSNEITVSIAVGIQGDYDGNGAVDELDHSVWRGNFGSTNIIGDGNGDQVIDAADYVVWRKNMSLGTVGVAASLASAVQAELTAEDPAASPAPSPIVFDTRGSVVGVLPITRKGAVVEMRATTVRSHVKSDLLLPTWRPSSRLLFENEPNPSVKQTAHDEAFGDEFGWLEAALKCTTEF
jgi:hypothetical protein